MNIEVHEYGQSKHSLRCIAARPSAARSQVALRVVPHDNDSDARHVKCRLPFCEAKWYRVLGAAV
jgi:hypothetical protein